MADLTGYTAMTDVHGGASAARIVNKYMSTVNAACAGSAKVVQRVGDQVVMIADRALDLLETVNRIDVEEHLFLSIHAGMHFGPVFIENDNLFGSTINVASRIMNLAKRSQTLCSDIFLSNVPSTHKNQFKSIGVHRLKNVIDAIELFELLPVSDKPSLEVDPVCHMHVDPGKAFETIIYNGTTYYFCSDRCFELFQSTPDRFTA